MHAQKVVLALCPEEMVFLPMDFYVFCFTDFAVIYTPFEITVGKWVRGIRNMQIVPARPTTAA